MNEDLLNMSPPAGVHRPAVHVNDLNALMVGSHGYGVDLLLEKSRGV